MPLYMTDNLFDVVTTTSCAGSRSSKTGLRRSSYCSVGAAMSQKPTEPANNHGLPADNRARSGGLSGDPGVPARRRVGSTGRSRSPTFPFLGGPTRECRTVMSGQAWAQETRNSLSWDRQRRSHCRGFPGGPRPLEAHVDKRMTSALGALSLAVLPLRICSSGEKRALSR